MCHCSRCGVMSDVRFWQEQCLGFLLRRLMCVEVRLWPQYWRVFSPVADLYSSSTDCTVDFRNVGNCTPVDIITSPNTRTFNISNNFAKYHISPSLLVHKWGCCSFALTNTNSNSINFNIQFRRRYDTAFPSQLLRNWHKPLQRPPSAQMNTAHRFAARSLWLCSVSTIQHVVTCL